MSDIKVTPEYNKLVKDIFHKKYVLTKDFALRDNLISTIQNNELLLKCLIIPFIETVVPAIKNPDSGKLVRLIDEFRDVIFDRNTTMFDDIKKFTNWQKRQIRHNTEPVRIFKKICTHLGFIVDSPDVITNSLILCRGGKVDALKICEVEPINFKESAGHFKNLILFKSNSFKILKTEYFQFLLLYAEDAEEIVFTIVKNQGLANCRFSATLNVPQFSIPFESVIYSGVFNKNQGRVLATPKNYTHWKPSELPF